MYNLNFQIVGQNFLLQQNSLDSHAKTMIRLVLKTLTSVPRLVRYCREEILILLDLRFGNICVSRCVEGLPWLEYTGFNNILTF